MGRFDGHDRMHAALKSAGESGAAVSTSSHHQPIISMCAHDQHEICIMRPKGTVDAGLHLCADDR